VALDLPLAAMPENIWVRVLNSESHSRGEYMGNEMQEVLHKQGIQPSMSRDIFFHLSDRVNFKDQDATEELVAPSPPSSLTG
jgi:hypothetical protein